MADDKKKTAPQKLKTILEYGKAAVDYGKYGIPGGPSGVVASALLGMAVKHAYDRGGEAEVMAATKKRQEDSRRGDIERDRAMTDTLLKDHAERERRRTQADKERTARFQPPATPPGQDRDALRGRPKIVIPD